MNPQPSTDARIDQILTALRTANPPAGLEARIAARLAQAAEARTQPAASHSTPFYTSVILNVVKDPCSLLVPAKYYSVAALALLAALTAFTLLHHRPSSNRAEINFNSNSNPIARDQVNTRPNEHATFQSSTSTLGMSGLPSRHAVPSPKPTLGTNELPQPSPSAQDDPDAIALAETRAPSRPAPPMPLTHQEQLIAAATRPGQPLQLAELDLARAPILRAAAQAHQTASLDRYVRSLLAPFALADALQPTTNSQPQQAPTPAPPISN